MALLVASGVCIGLSMWLYKTPWEHFEKAISKNVGDVASAILILFLIGAISGTWTMSGVVPAFIYYGLHIISPKVFLLTTCILCAVVSLMTGSSWTTIATVGVALLGASGIYFIRKFFGIILMAISVKLFFDNVVLLI